MPHIITPSTSQISLMFYCSTLLIPVNHLLGYCTYWSLTLSPQAMSSRLKYTLELDAAKFRNGSSFMTHPLWAIMKQASDEYINVMCSSRPLGLP